MITKVMITTPHDTPDPSHHGKWARATLSWPWTVIVGFFSRLLVPRSMRRAVHPGRAVKRAVTPKAVKKARRALHPVDNAKYSVQRSVATTIRSDRKRKARVWRHGNCPVNHRSPETADLCRSP